jgi:peptidoglycan/xylan/chitin deacetylase (PgdA/CDA1 family)
MNKIGLAFLVLLETISNAGAKEIALTFDDAPFGSSNFFDTEARTVALVEKLKALKVPPAIIFANACKREDLTGILKQLKKYRDAGHFIGNHTCSHPRLDNVGFEKYSGDAEKGDQLLAPLFSGQKYFRYPFLNEGKEEKVRDQMREWLKARHYRNGLVSVDNDDYFFSERVSKAKELNKKIDLKKIEDLFVRHVAGAADFYDALAVKTLGRSPKHVLLLHDRDMTVMFLGTLLQELENRGWKLVSAVDAYQDKMYLEQPKNNYSGNGIVAQIAMEKTGERISYGDFNTLRSELDKVLGLDDHQ